MAPCTFRRLFPPFSQILDVNARVMAHLLQHQSPQEGRSPEQCLEMVRAHMWHAPQAQQVRSRL